jgi:hypothetical protein
MYYITFIYICWTILAFLEWNQLDHRVCFYFVIFFKLCWGYIVTFAQILTVYHSWIHPSIILLYSLSPIPGIVSTGLNFHFHTWVHNISTILTVLHPFLVPCPLPLVPTPNRTCFTCMFSIFGKRYFCLFKIAIQEVSLWHFYAYMYYNPNWFIPLFLLSTLVYSLWWFW